MVDDVGAAAIGAGIGLAGAAAGGGIGLAAVGAVTSLVGGYLGHQAAQGQYQAESNIAQLQKQMNSLSLNQMEMTARRNQLQEIRNAQQARSTALTNATGRGASTGNTSAFGGAVGNIFGTAGNNLLSLNQNLSIGRQEATVQSSIIDQQLAASKYKSQAATAAGISSLGGGISSAGGSIFSAATNPSGTLFT